MQKETKRRLRLRRSLLTLMTGLVLFGLVFPPNSRASEFDKKTILTFSGHVQFPGVVLGPGTYVVKRVDWGQPDILMISNSEENHSYAMVHAIPIQRMRPADNVKVSFYETKGLAAPAVRALFYPGDTIGEQFVYPKGSQVLMGLAGRPVTPASTPIATEPANTPNEPEASTTASETAKEEPPAQPDNNQIAEAINPSPTPAPSAASPEETQKELPKTASDVPLLALLGGLALAVGAGLKHLAI